MTTDAQGRALRAQGGHRAVPGGETLVGERMIRRWFGPLCCGLLAVPASVQAKELMDLYRLAQKQDQTYIAALHTRDASVEAYPQALASVLPQISSNSTLGRTRIHNFRVLAPGLQPTDPVYYNNYSWGVNLSQVLFSWPVFETLAKSNLQVAQANATFLAAEQSLVYRLADAFFTVLNAQDTLNADTDAQAAYKLAQDEARAKYENGVVAITDVRNAEASYDSSSATVIADKRALDAARLALSQIVGLADDAGGPRNESVGVVSLLDDVPEARPVTLRDEIPLVRPDPAEEKQWADVAIDENPGLMTFRYAAKAAEKDISIASTNWVPTVSATGSIGRSAQDVDGGTDQLNEGVGVQFSWRIFQGGLVLSRTRQAKATKEAALAQFEGQRRVVNTAARNAYKGIVAGIASIKATQRAVLSAKVSLEATQVGLKVGTRTQLDVLTAQQTLTQAQRNFYAARYDYLRNSLALKQAAGQLTEEDLAKIDELLVSR